MSGGAQAESIESHAATNNNLPFNDNLLKIVESNFLGISFDGFTNTQSCKHFEAQHRGLGASCLSAHSHFEFEGNDCSLDPHDVHFDSKMAHLSHQLSLLQHHEFASALNLIAQKMKRQQEKKEKVGEKTELNGFDLKILISANEIRTHV